jgi:hypothetical protein
MGASSGITHNIQGSVEFRGVPANMACSPLMTQGAMVFPVVMRGRIEPSVARRFSTPYTLSLLTRPFQAQLSSDQRVDHPLRQKQR